MNHPRDKGSQLQGDIYLPMQEASAKQTQPGIEIELGVSLVGVMRYDGPSSLGLGTLSSCGDYSGVGRI